MFLLEALLFLYSKMGSYNGIIETLEISLYDS